MNWHYMKNGAQTGPVTTDELKAMLASGAIRPDTLVWREGLAGWGAISAQPEFAGVAAPVPPPPAPGGGTASASVPPGAFTPSPADVEKNKIFAVLAYLGLLFLVPLLAAKDSPFARYHTNQGLTLFLCLIAGMVCAAIIMVVPFIGWLIGILLWMCVGFGGLALAIMGIINAANGVCKPLPVIGNKLNLIK